jgi:MFS family permease
MDDGIKKTDSQEAVAGSGRMYKVGTLAYTKAALFEVLFWMLLGDFCLTMMEGVFPTVVPLQLRWAGAGDLVVGLVTLSIPALLTLVFNPIMAMQSDRHRGPLGRRRPFLLWFTPIVVIALVLLGTGKPIAHWLANVFVPEGGSAAADNLTVILIGLFSILFSTGNIYILSSYQYLFKDVIPTEVLGRFVGLYRTIGALASFVFNRYVVGQTEAHTALVYISTAILYAVAFFLLVWKVKEGDYPPPEEKKGGLRATYISYLKGAFGNPFYLKVYAQGFFFWGAWAPFMTFIIFFATESKQPGYAASLGLSLDEFGKIKGWTVLCQAPVFLLAGWLTDRFHPLRVLIAGGVMTATTYFASFFLVNSATSFLILWTLNTVSCGMFLAAYLAMLTRLLPAARYGQFFSANQIVFQGGLMGFAALVGWLINTVKDYRCIYLWSGTMSVLGIIMGVALYRHWKRLGGDEGYVPPECNNQEK